jgi:peptidoglycan/xylan/chitin deacetylase (PgdA/CDA1 family)
MDRRKLLTGAAVLGAGGALGAVGGIAGEKAAAAMTPTSRTARPAGPGTYVVTTTFRTSPAARLIALTIDDGPTPEWTPQVLKILDRYRAKATFFRVGQRVQAARHLAVQTAEAGHEQGNHTWAHKDLTQNDEAADQYGLVRTQELLAEVTGRAPSVCRPPWGRIDSVGLAVCASLRCSVALWSHHVTGSDPEANVNGILQQATPGSIVLAHDGGTEPNPALMRQLDRLVGSMTDDGYTFVTVSDLLAAPPDSAA